jgi:hypothetical protein
MWMIAQAFLRHKHLRKLATRESVGAHRFVRQQSGGDHLAQEAKLPASLDVVEAQDTFMAAGSGSRNVRP